VSQKLLAKIKANKIPALIPYNVKSEALNSYCSQGDSRKSETMTKIRNVLKAHAAIL